MPYLVFDSGEGQRIQVRVTAKGIRIGRDPACDLVIPVEAASRHHATVTLDGERVMLKDLASHNGTFVNGARVTDGMLRDKDRLVIGGFTITFLQKDPYGEDSLELASRRGLRGEGTEEPKRAEITKPAAPASGASPAPASRSRRVPLLGLFILLASIGLGAMALFAWALWQRVPQLKPGAPPSAGATWQDAEGIVSVTAPPGFTEAERMPAGLRLLGPSGARYASSITIEIRSTAPQSSASSEMKLLERSLTAELGTSYERRGMGGMTLAGHPAMSLIYQRPTPEGVMLQHWVVLCVVEGRRLAFRLTAELGGFEAVKPSFTQLLGGVILPVPAAGVEARP